MIYAMNNKLQGTHYLFYIIHSSLFCFFSENVPGCGDPNSQVRSRNAVVLREPLPIAQARYVVGNYCLRQSDQQTDYGSKQGYGLDKSRNNQHGSLDTASSLRLTSNTFHCRSADPTNTQTSTDSSQASTNSSTHDGYATRSFQQD
jgi:hypothetical protein